MKKYLLIPALLVLCVGLRAQNQTHNKYGASEDYRRSSLCIIMLTHKGTKYAEEMEAQFNSATLPTRYNEHDCHVRVINVSKQVKGSYVEYLMKNSKIANELVARWFNRNSSTGVMNMELIHERGGYNANYADQQRVLSTERGLDFLREEGTELIQNTFVLVCDMDYYDKEKSGRATAAFLDVAAFALNSYANAQEEEGNTKAAGYANFGSAMASAGAVVADNIGGFAVKMNAHLLRLKWDNDILERFYNDYWVDESSSSSEASFRRSKFDNERQLFSLEYIGDYYTRSDRVVMKNQADLNMVIRAVTAETVTKGMTNLAKIYPIFRPKSAFESDGPNDIYAYIGTKEGVTTASKYEVVEPRRDKAGNITYKRIALVTPIYDEIWDNRDFSFTDISPDTYVPGTIFERVKGKADFSNNNGYYIREQGSIYPQYKQRRVTFAVGFATGHYSISESDMAEASGKIGKTVDDTYHSTTTGWYGSIDQVSGYSTSGKGGLLYGIELGMDINFSPVISWNIVQSRFLFGGDASKIEATSGLIVRAPALGSQGRYTFFISPSLGIGVTKGSYTQEITHELYVYYESSDYLKTTTSKYSNDINNAKISYFNWCISGGMNITKNIYVSYRYGAHNNHGLSVGVKL